MAIEPKLPIGYYVYTISVADVVRYIGKGKGLRLYSHMKEVRSRLNRDYSLQNIGSRLQHDSSWVRLPLGRRPSGMELVSQMPHRSTIARRRSSTNLLRFHDASGSFTAGRVSAA